MLYIIIIIIKVQYPMYIEVRVKWTMCAFYGSQN